MSWNLSLQLSNLYQAVKYLQTTALTNPLTANINMNNLSIINCPIIQGGIAGGGPTLQTYVGLTAMTISNLGAITASISLSTPTLTATTGNFNNIVLPLPSSYSITLIVGNYTISIPVRLNLTFDPSYTVGQQIIVSGASQYNGTYIIQAVNGAGSYDLSTNPSGSSSPITTGLVKLNAGNFTCQNLTTTNATVGTLTFPDASSQTTANDVYINGTTANIYYPIACVGTSTTGRTSLYTDGVGHITYNPTSNTININNSGKISLNGASALFQNTTASQTYRVPSTFKHSFEVVSTEIAKVDSTGISSTNFTPTSASNQTTSQPLIYGGSNSNQMVLCDNLHQTYNLMNAPGYAGWTRIVNTPQFNKYTAGSIINFWGSGSCYNGVGGFSYTVAIYNSANVLQESFTFSSCYFDNATLSRKTTSWGGVSTASIPIGTYYLQMRTATANNNTDAGDNAIMSWSITSN